MAKKKVRVVAVEDSSFFKRVLTDDNAKNYGIEMIGIEENFDSAINLIKNTKPDVVVLDFELKKLNTTEFVKKVKEEFAVPVISISTQARDAYVALNAGSTEFIRRATLAGGSDKLFINELIIKILTRSMSSSGASAATEPKTASTSTGIGTASGFRTQTGQATQGVQSAQPTQNVQLRTYVKYEKPKTAAQTTAFAPSLSPLQKMQGDLRSEFRKVDKKKIIVIGASTGGTEALHKVLTALPADIPGILIVQHMPAGFTKLFAERLNRDCPFEVKEAQNGDIVKQGRAIVAAGDFHLRLMVDGGEYKVKSTQGERVSGHCPSVDAMFTSVAEVADNTKVIGVILTGMGRDGASGMLKMHQKGAFTIGQDEKSCVVYGMPKEAYLMGGVCKQLPLGYIANEIVYQAFK